MIWKTKKIFIGVVSILFFLLNSEFLLNKFAGPIKNRIISLKGKIYFIRNQCKIPIINYVPSDSTVVIGHAYGSHVLSNEREKNSDSFLAPSVSKFLDLNRSKISTLILSGDVFSNPTKEKWIKLFTRYESDFEIFIAPGNHDIGYLELSNLRDLFSKEVFNLDSYPLFINRSGFKLLIDNSIENKYLENLKFIEFFQNLNNRENLIIIRHHIPIRELLYLSNDRINFKDLPNYKKVESVVNNTILISGDGGAFKYLQRIACINFNSNKYIVNGIGETDGDRVIILDNGNLKQYIINNSKKLL